MKSVLMVNKKLTLVGLILVLIVFISSLIDLISKGVTSEIIGQAVIETLVFFILSLMMIIIYRRAASHKKKPE